MERKKYLSDMIFIHKIIIFSNFQNTFQCIIATDGESSYALFVYDDIQWFLTDSRGASGSGSGIGSGSSSSSSGSNSFRYLELVCQSL